MQTLNKGHYELSDKIVHKNVNNLFNCIHQIMFFFSYVTLFFFEITARAKLMYDGLSITFVAPFTISIPTIVDVLMAKYGSYSNQIRLK